MLLFLSWIWAFYKLHSVREQVNSGFGMPNPSPEIMFLQAMVNDMDRIDNLPTLISLICAFTWMILLAALTRTKIFGPHIAMIVKMIQDILHFLVIYVI